MATGTIARLDALAKDVYPMGSKILKQFNEGTPLLDLIETTEKVPFLGKKEGRRIYIPVHTGPNPNAAVGVAEEGGLPYGSTNAMDKLTFNVASHWQAMKHTGLLEDTQGGGDQSVEDWLPGEMRRQRDNARRKMGWLLHGDGSGLLGTLNSSGNSGSTLQFAANTNLDMISADSTGARSTEIIIRDLDQGTKESGQTANKALRVLTKTGSGGASPQITVQHEDGTSYTASGADLSAYGVYHYDSQGSSLIGIGAYCDDANPLTWGSTTAYVGNINRSTAGNEWWRAYQNTLSTAAPLDVVAHLQDALDNINARAGAEIGSDDQLVGVMRYGNYRALGNQLSRDQRTAAPTKMLTGGFGRKYPALEYENCAFVLDRDAPITKVRIINTKKARRYIMRDWGWREKTGAIWIGQTATDGRDADVYKAYLYCRQQLIFLTCLCNAEIGNLSASS